MDKGQIKHITNSGYRKLKKCLKKISASFDAEAIHRFRVGYKKLRAFFRMLSQQNDAKRKIKIVSQLKKAYSISGAVRNLQLQQQRIAAAPKQVPEKTQAYLTLLQKEIDKLKPELLEIFSENAVAESKKKTNAALPDKLQLLDLKVYVKKKWAAVNAIITSNCFSDNNLHLIRKNLKDMFYNLKIYQGMGNNVSPLPIWNGKDEKYFDQLLNELGSFQDKCTAIALLKPHWLNSLDKYNRKIPEQTKKIWTKEKKSQKRLLIKKIKTDLLP
jgi:CHAD domain-containing protein